MATEFTTEFDGTDGAAANLTTENPTSATINALTNRTAFNGWFYETSAKVSGTASMWTENEAANPTNTSTWTYTSVSVTTHYYDMCWRVTALPAASTMVFQIRDGATNKAQITLAADGTIALKNGTTTVESSASGFAVAGQWMRLQWGITGSTQTARLWSSATPADLLNLSANDTLGGGTNSYTGGAWNQFRFGVMSAQDLTIWFDRMVVDNSTWPTSGGSGNAAPTANAGPDQDSVIGGQTVTLTGAGSSDSDGTIASYAWTQTLGTTVALSSSTVVGPTFTAPDSAGTATFQLRVTDDDGAQSSPDTVVIEWSDAPTAVPTSDFYELFTGSDGATVNTSTSDFDNVTSSSWTFTDDDPANGAVAATAAGSGSVKIMTHDIAAIGEIYADALFKIDDLSAGPWYIMRLLSSSTLRATVRVNTNGSIQCRNAGTAVGDPGTSAQVAEGEWFRVAWHVTNGSPGTQEARLFRGGNLYGTSPTSTTSGAYNSGTFDHVGFGIAQPAVASGNIVVDTVQVNAAASGWPDPFGGSSGGVTSGVYAINANGTTTALYMYDL